MTILLIRMSNMPEGKNEITEKASVDPNVRDNKSDSERKQGNMIVI